MTDKNKQSAKIAEQNYDVSNYKNLQQPENGLATAHEQVNDTLIEGAIDAIISNGNGIDMSIPQEGYEDQ